jgi:hypothetical protein
MPSKKVIFAFLGVFALSLLIFFHSDAGVHANLSWSIQTVDESADTFGFQNCPLVLDSNNEPHITYASHNLVKYASWSGSDWNIQSIAGGDPLSLVLDNSSNPHILYSSLPVGPLKYTSWTGTKWTNQTTISQTNIGAMALDSFGNPHVAYVDVDNQLLMYAKWNGSSWVNQTVDVNSTIPQFSITLNSNNNPYILYSVGGYPRDIKLAEWTKSGWVVQTVVSDSTMQDGFSNLVFDSKGYPHFFYHPGINTRNVVYASWNGTGWEMQNAVLGDNVDSVSSMALDSYDYPHLSYITEDRELKYVTWTGQAWVIQTVESDITPQWMPPTLVVDSERIPHITILGEDQSTTETHI